MPRPALSGGSRRERTTADPGGRWTGVSAPCGGMLAGMALAFTGYVGGIGAFLLVGARRPRPGRGPLGRGRRQRPGRTGRVRAESPMTTAARRATTTDTDRAVRRIDERAADEALTGQGSKAMATVHGRRAHADRDVALPPPGGADRLRPQAARASSEPYRAVHRRAGQEPDCSQRRDRTRLVALRRQGGHDRTVEGAHPQGCEVPGTGGEPKRHEGTRRGHLAGGHRGPGGRGKKPLVRAAYAA
ncbi:hypothetical protein SAMN05216533_3054 [Streptomyces sp. Ag109_O5-10]|nr:hypothetical protein SAMN05216533_3054 [Streptomyces sp. Ag109_O5-10]